MQYLLRASIHLYHIIYISHPLGNLDAQQPHTQTHYLGHFAREGETECAYIRIFFTQNTIIVIELIVFLHQIIAIVGNEGRTESSLPL